MKRKSAWRTSLKSLLQRITNMKGIFSSKITINIQIKPISAMSNQDLRKIKLELIKPTQTLYMVPTFKNVPPTTFTCNVATSFP